MTTNGFFLSKYAQPLKEAGLKRLNISLDTLNPEKFKKITGFDGFKAAMAGIKEASRVGIFPIKINMVLLNKINSNEIIEMINFVEKNLLILQIIELEWAAENEKVKKYRIDLKNVENYLKNKAEKITVRRMHHRKQYKLKNGVEVETVKPMDNAEFCRYCSRIRVTSDGKLKPCLFRNDNLVDLLSCLRKGASTKVLKALFVESVGKRKPYFA
jgi:cyclic pyranopterin phosphate synthase